VLGVQSSSPQISEPVNVPSLSYSVVVSPSKHMHINPNTPILSAHIQCPPPPPSHTPPNCRMELETVVAALEKAWKAGRQVVVQDRRLTPTACAAGGPGPLPTINDCMAGLHEIW
jgi:hypothetical protein